MTQQNTCNNRVTFNKELPMVAANKSAAIATLLALRAMTTNSVSVREPAYVS
jgi:hypothetical protein